MSFHRRILLAGPFVFFVSQSHAQQPLSNRFLGRADAEMQVEDFSSLTCPHCATFALGAFHSIRTRFIESGQVRWIFRDFPLDALGLFAAKILRSVPLSDYYITRRFLFAEQEKWVRSPRVLFELMSGIGLDETAMTRIAEDDALSREVLNERIWGQNTYGVNATPSFVMTRPSQAVHSLRRGRMDEETFAQWLNTPLR
jgi:protein-disulfide isomerase